MIIWWVFQPYMIYSFLHTHFSESFIPFFTVCHDNSGISPLLRMSHHFFHAPRSHPGSKFTLCPRGLCQVYLYRAIKVSRLFPIQCNVQIPSESTPMLFPCSFQFTLARSYSSFGFFLTNHTFLWTIDNRPVLVLCLIFFEIKSFILLGSTSLGLQPSLPPLWITRTSLYVCNQRISLAFISGFQLPITYPSLYNTFL